MSRYPYTPIRGPGQPGYASHTKGLAQAVDFRCPEGTPIYAPSNSRWRVNHSANMGSRSYGQWIELGRVGASTRLRFAHLSRRLVSGSQTIAGGRLLGYTGNTGNSKGAHLHFEATEDIWGWADWIWEANVLNSEDKAWIRSQLQATERRQYRFIVRSLTTGWMWKGGLTKAQESNFAKYLRNNLAAVLDRLKG